MNRVRLKELVHALEDPGSRDKAEDPAGEEDRDRCFDPDGKVEREQGGGQRSKERGERIVTAEVPAKAEDEPCQSSREAAPGKVPRLRVEQDHKRDPGDKRADPRLHR